MRKRNKIWMVIALMVTALGFIAYRAAVWNRDVYVVSMADAGQVNQKLMGAVKNGYALELTEADVNRIVKDYFLDTGKLEGKVKVGYIKILEGEVQLSAVMPVYGINFFIQSFVKPYMEGGNIKIEVQKVYVGRIEVPQSICTYVIQRYLPSNIKAVDNSIDIGNKIMMFDIENLSVDGSMVKIGLKQGEAQEAAAQEPRVAETKAEGNNNAAANESTSSKTTPAPPKQTQEQQKADPKVEALKKTNNQLYGVLGDVKSTEGKDWVRQVIAVNTKMMDNPDGDYSGDIQSGKAVYQSLPSDVKTEVKMAAMDNLDMASVKLLVTSYGM